MDYFGYCQGRRDDQSPEKMDALFDGPPRKAETEITQREMDIAASIQAVTEEIVLKHRAARPRADRARSNL